MSEPPAGPGAAALFEQERRHLLGVAYRLLGTVTDAEDVLQDVFERWLRLDHASVVNPAAYLTTMTTRAAIDRLRSARTVREVYVGPWLPEPVPTPAAGSGQPDRSPESLAELDESLSIGYLHLLERLTPHERAAHLLHDVYDFSYREIASMIDRSEVASRQLASRARSKLKASRPDRDRAPVPTGGEELVQRLVSAMGAGDIEGVMSVLADDVVHLSDGGPQHRAARRPVVGRDRVARLLANLAGRLTPEQVAVLDIRFLRLNQQPGVLILLGDEPLTALTIESDGERIERIYAVVNPDKLRAVQAGS